MDTADLRTQFDDLRPRIPDHVQHELKRLLGDEPIVHAQAGWEQPRDEQGLTVDVFTKKHRLHVSLAKSPRPLIVSITPLVFSRIQCEDDNYVAFIGDDEVSLLRSQKDDNNHHVRQATAEPEVFARWAIEHGAWS